MNRHTTTALVLFLTFGAASQVEAQYSAGQSCPPGQPCVVVPQAQPQPAVQYAPAPVPVRQRQAVEVRSSRLRWGMIAPGIAMIVGGWVANWLVGLPGAFAVREEHGSGSSTDYYGWAWVPVIGPFVDAGFFASGRYAGFLALHLVFGVLQSAGLVFCILGTVLREEVVQVRYVLGDDPNGPRLSVLPYADQHGGGLMATIAGF
jgi:hypothetical protein